VGTALLRGGVRKRLRTCHRWGVAPAFLCGLQTVMRIPAVLVALLACFLGHVGGAAAQGPARASERTAALKVFVDCRFTCDGDFLRHEINVVNYVRDRTEADLHVILTRQPTGGGGTEVSINFIGLHRFTGIDAVLTYTAPQASTADEQREGLVRVVKRGLVRYIADTPLADQVIVTFSAPRGRAEDVDDRWNLWVFRTSFGGSVSGERANQGRSIRLTASASRTTPAWKFTTSGAGGYRADTYALGDAETFKSVSRNFDLRVSGIRSLTDHWSAGVVGEALSSTFLNYDFKARLASGFEYNVFPYTDSTTRMLTVHYTVGANDLKFHEETVSGKLSDRLADHELGTSLTLLQPWGTASGDISFAQFLRRADQYSVTAVGNVDVRLFKGFSFTVYNSVSRTRDQIYLPRADLSAAEILVRERELATTYRYLITFGISYSFGSIFNNVVNQRFGGVGGEATGF